MTLPHPGDPLHLYGQGRLLTWKSWLALGVGVSLLIGGVVLARYLQVKAEVEHCHQQNRFCSNVVESD